MTSAEGKLSQAKNTLATNYQKGLAGVTAVALAMIGAGVYKADTAQSDPLKATETQPTAQTASLLSPHYMAKHCKIVASVNVGGGHPTGHAPGLSLEGKNAEATINGIPDQGVREYTWQVSGRDKFCGIVGVSYPSIYTSFQPTTETAHGGEYTDTSVGQMTTTPGTFVSEFIAYAQPKA